MQIDRFPKLDAGATTEKFDRFIYDEVGIFSATMDDQLSKLAYDLVAAANVEIVTFVARDLQGRTADQLGLRAMRQLCVCKLEVGNGAVLVVARDANQTGFALAGGLLGVRMLAGSSLCVTLIRLVVCSRVSQRQDV